jgi:capsular exopolysaccharide synthesis family protein
MGNIPGASERRLKENHAKAETFSMRQPKKSNEKGLEHVPVRQVGTRGESQSILVAQSAPDSFDAESFKSLGARLRFPKDGKRCRTIMITSAFPGEGKSYVAGNLAAGIALGINEYVLAVDCDLRRPTLHKIFGCGNSEGLHEYLIGKRQLQGLIVRSKIEKLSLVPAGSKTFNPTELFSSAMMRDFLEEIRGRYQDRFIIIDAPPSQVTAEPNILANYVDGIIFVIMAQKSHREAIQSSMENLGRDKILGIFFNGYNKTHTGYYKYYKNYYKR